MNDISNQHMTAPESGTEEVQTRVVLVTGPSGAGRSTAINVLEDLGYEAIANQLFHGRPTLVPPGWG